MTTASGAHSQAIYLISIAVSEAALPDYLSSFIDALI